MFKKVVAGLVVASIISTGGMALAKAPEQKRGDAPRGPAVAIAQLNRARDKEKVKLMDANTGTSGHSRVEIITWPERPKTPKPSGLQERLQQKAEGLGIETKGLTLEEIREKIKEAQAELREEKKLERLKTKAEKLGIDITGLSVAELKVKIEEALKEQCAEDQLERLQKKAAELGIDIDGISLEEVRAKVREAMKELWDEKQLERMERKLSGKVFAKWR